MLDEGPYNNDGHTPPYYTGFERYSLGWLTPKEIGSSARHSLDDISTNQAFIITTQNENEFFILENRQQKNWDRFIPGHGMLIWHIDYNEGIWNTNTVNNKRSHQYVDIEEADAVESDGTRSADTFPGTSHITEFTDETTPNMRTWDETAQNKPITNITENNGIILFTISGGYQEVTPATALEATNVGMQSFTANWQAGDDNVDYLLSVFTTSTLPSGKVEYSYVDGFEKKNVGNVTSFDVTGLAPATLYKYSVVCYDRTADKESASSNEIEVTTLEPSFDFFSPTALPATNVSADGFTANWQVVDGATDYILNVYTKESGEEKIETVDFAGGIAALPQGWDTNSTLTYSQSSYSGESAPALRLASTDAYITSPQFGDGISEFSFWHRGANAASSARLVISALTDTRWSEIEQLEITNATGGIVTTYSEEQLPHNCKAINITYITDQRGSVAIDDIKLSHGKYGNNQPIDNLTDLNVGDATSHNVALQINSGTHYFYTVKAVKEGITSALSNEILVSFSTSVNNIVCAQIPSLHVADGMIHISANSDTDVAIYNLTGSVIAHFTARAGDSSHPAPTHGLYIISLNNRAAKLLVR